ncbi:MAG: hypothetical protein HY692_07605 [Cyanobacteria bacterium NC_groundwater_1444_Ag_S-0.65um_54_12]|nr:hypothetical protein [Cyanobacteria bacterium NC_groundwater_1444_Ag_S-0.65um_54_12]
MLFRQLATFLALYIALELSMTHCRMAIAAVDTAKTATGKVALLDERVLTNSGMSAIASNSISLGIEQRNDLVQILLNQKPDPANYAIASALLPGFGELALGEWREPTLIWALLVAASTGVFYLKTGVVGIHSSLLATSPYVMVNGFRLPGLQDNEQDLFNRFLQISYLFAAGWTAWRSYQLAIFKRQEIDRQARLLDP